MGQPDPPDYAALLTGAGGDWDVFSRGALLEAWTARYVATTSWEPVLLEVEQGSVKFLFDAAPTLNSVDGDGRASDRVVGVWGRSAAPTAGRDRGRLGGFLPDASRWSGRDRDRGHLVAHAAGGGLDMNLIPQASMLNRGRSPAGRRWRSMEKHAARHPGAPLFVCPVYDGPGWEPAWLEYGLVVDGRLWFERFANA